MCFSEVEEELTVVSRREVTGPVESLQKVTEGTVVSLRRSDGTGSTVVSP